MIKEFKYRPPFLFAFLGLGGLYVSFMLLRAIGYGEIGFQFLVGFFGLFCLAVGAYFSINFVNRIGSGHLRVTDDFIEIPGRWRTRTTVLLTEIDGIRTIESYDIAIEIKSKGRLYQIDGKLMTKGDFLELKGVLANYKIGEQPPSFWQRHYC